MHWKRITALAAAGMLAVAACGSPADDSDTPEGQNNENNQAQTKVMDAAAKGPAKEIAGAKQGGIVTSYYETTPSTFDPTDTYYTDGNQIEKLYFRTLTQFDLRDGKPVLVPDLAEDLGTRSADGLSWTFKLKKGIKYQDGSEVKAEDYAYAIKRSFAHDLFSDGPAYQLDFFKDGDKYKGPYGKDGDTYAGVETPDDNTLVIHLRKKFDDMPFYAAFAMFTPIPKAKDTKENYQLKPMATGPYQVASYNPGTELKLTKNPNWDPKTDPVRHQYLDGFDFKWGGDTVKQQQQVLASSGVDANALHYGNIDSTLVPQLNDSNKSQLIQGAGPCTYLITMDSRRIPLEVRKAIATAYPYETIRKVAGLTSLAEPPASTILPASVPGYAKYELPGLNGRGDGDAAKAKQMLKDAGKENFELSWYFSNDNPIATRTSQARAQAMEKAGFKVKAIGVPKAQIRKLTGDQNAPVNMLKTPAGWCSDWPSGTSWYQVLFKSDAIAAGNSAGQLQSKELDAEIDRVDALPPEQQVKEWMKLDKTVLEKYLPVLPWYYGNSAFLVGKNVGHAINDPTQGMPEFTSLYLKKP